MLTRFAPALLAALAFTGAARADEVCAVEGTFDDPVVAIEDARGGIVVRTARRAIPLDQVKSIRLGVASVAPRAGTRLVLTTGEVLQARIIGGRAEADGRAAVVVVASEALGELEVSLDLLRAVIADVPEEREHALRRALDPDDHLDRVVVKSGGVPRGSLREIDADGVVIDTGVPGGTDTGVLRLSHDAVEWIATSSPAIAPPQKLWVTVRLVDGTALTSARVRLDGDALRLEHPLGGGGELTLRRERVAELTVENGAFVYVSDLEPVEVEQGFPADFVYEVDVWGWKRDRSVTGGPLRVGARAYAKGLGVHSRCSLTYRLDGQYRELRAVIGLDDSVLSLGEPGVGAVVFRVLVDGKPAREHPQGVVQRKGQLPTALVVDTTGARSITLSVEHDPSSLHILGRADWADAHLLRR